MIAPPVYFEGERKSTNMATVEKFRVNNPHPFSVGIITMDKPYGMAIPPHSFTLLTQDEIDYLISICTLFQDGTLQVAGEKQKEVADTIGLDMENNANFMSDEDIKKKLSGNANQLRKWLDSDSFKPYVMERIAELAKEMNLSANKLSVLKEKLPNYEFI